MDDHAALVRVTVLCRLLREALDTLDTEIPTGQLNHELALLQEQADSKLNRVLEPPQH